MSLNTISNASSETFESVPSGTEVVLTRTSLLVPEAEGGGSEPQRLKGKLAEPISVGNPVKMENGTMTSPVKRMYRRLGRYCIDTDITTYDVVMGNTFNGLQLKNELGTVIPPADMATAKLGGDRIDLQIPADQLRAEGGPWKVHIDTSALEGILLEAHNGEIFKVGKNLIVLARVGDIHLPFYRTAGTKWEPFFGQVGEHMVAGTDGNLLTDGELARVQAILNENLDIPVAIVSEAGKIGTSAAAGGLISTEVIFDIGRYLKYQSAFFTEYGRDQDNFVSFVSRITGYSPEKVSDPASEEKWRAEILSRIAQPS